MNWSTYSGFIHVAPIRTSISEASRSFGITASSAFAFTSYSGLLSTALFATASFSLTLPDRYSSAVCHSSLKGSLNITPTRSSVISVSLFPVSSIIYGMSTFAFSESETASASLAVSTLVTTSARLMVRFVNMSAFSLKFPSESNFSREHSRL